MPGLVALRHNPILQIFGARMKTNGLAPKAVVGAAMRKLAHLIYGVVKSGKPFDVDFALKGLQFKTVSDFFKTPTLIYPSGERSGPTRIRV